MVDDFDEERIVKMSKAAPKDDLTKDVLITKPKKIVKRKIVVRKVPNLNKARSIATKVAKGLIEANKLSKEEKLAQKQAQAQRMRQIQAQRQGAIQQTGFDNKFERQLIAQQMAIDEEERRRRFHEVPDDFLLRRAQIKDLQLQRKRECEMRNNLFRAHKKQFHVRLNLLNVDEQTNLMSTPLVWNPNNPDNNVFEDRGRETILDAPNRFAVTEENRRMNILNAQKLNWGNVDTRRKPRRRFIEDDRRTIFQD